MATIDDNNALLLYRVGPVLCCSPCLPVSAIIEPRPLTRPPGTSQARPGIFKYANTIVSTLDLRYKFGVEQAEWVDPGRNIVTQLAQGAIGFQVDEIIDVITLPASGWGPLPPLLPRGIFSRTLLLKDGIYLYAEFAALQRIPDSGYLRQYIVHLQETQRRQQAAHTATAVANVSSSSAATAHAKHATTDTPARITSASMSSLQQQPAAIQSPRTTVTSAVTAAATPRQQTAKRTVATLKSKPSDLKSAVTARESSRNKPITTAATPTPTKQSSGKVVTLQKSTQHATTARTATRSAGDRIAAPPTPATRHVNNAAQPVNQSTPTSAQPTSQPSPPAQNGSVVRVLLVLLLVMGSSATALWYWLFAPTEHKAVHVSTLQIPASNPATPALKIETAPNPTATSLAPVTADTATTADNTTPIPHATTSEDSTEPAAASDSSPAHTAAVEPVSSTPVTSSEVHYSATIERDKDGLTITLEAPADDPVFTQHAQTPATEKPSNDMSSASESETGSAAPPVAEPGASTTLPATPTTVEPKPAPVDTVEIIHIVVKGDTLWHIAKRYVNNPYRYPELARLSKIRNPDLIYPGNRVRILKRKRQQ